MAETVHVYNLNHELIGDPYSKGSTPLLPCKTNIDWQAIIKSLPDAFTKEAIEKQTTFVRDMIHETHFKYLVFFKQSCKHGDIFVLSDYELALSLVLTKGKRLEYEKISHVFVWLLYTKAFSHRKATKNILNSLSKINF